MYKGCNHYFLLHHLKHCLHYIYLYNDDFTTWDQSKKFDVIVSNPPYFDSKDDLHRSKNIHKKLARHEGSLNLSSLAKSIKNHLKEDWSLERISKIDLAILRLAIYEITYREDIPCKVSVNEAVELAEEGDGLLAALALGERHDKCAVEGVARGNAVDGLHLPAGIELPAIPAVSALRAHRDDDVPDAALQEDVDRLLRALRVRHLDARQKLRLSLVRRDPVDERI